jgi:hypothetical protein
MSDRPGIEVAAVLAAFLICAAFIASFVIGLRREPALPTDSDPVPVPQAPAVRAAGRVEVLNASGRAGMARAATDHLRGGGFDVVFFGNAPAGFAGDSTLVIDRTGDDAVARAVARYLGVGTVTTVRDTSLFVDATVVIGRDWRER